MEKAYRTIRKQGKTNEQELVGFLVKNGQTLLPMVDLIEQCLIACDELIDVSGRATIQAMLRLSARAIARIKKLAEWPDEKYPQAAASLLEDLEECFTINRLDFPPALHRCLTTTNIIDGPHARVRIETRRVTHWQNGKMVLRWMASTFLRTEKRFNRVICHKDPWAMEAILNPTATASKKVA